MAFIIGDTTFIIGDTRLSKDSSGWEAKTRIKFDGVVKTSMGEDGQRCLTLRTYKNSRGMLQTSASASIVANGFESFIIFGDFSKTVMSVPAKRVTEKDVRNQQAQVLIQNVPELIGEMETFYAVKAGTDKAARRAREGATNRPGGQAASFAEETGLDYATAARLCNMD